MGYRIASVSAKTGLSTHTLRYYEKEGLLPFVGRTASGVRDFSEQDLEWIKVITCLKNTGMPIRDIRRFLICCKEGDSTLQERLDMFTRQKAAAEKKLAELQEHLHKIQYKIWYYTTALEAGTEAIHQKGGSSCTATPEPENATD